MTMRNIKNNRNKRGKYTNMRRQLKFVRYKTHFIVRE